MSALPLGMEVRATLWRRLPYLSIVDSCTIHPGEHKINTLELAREVAALAGDEGLPRFRCVVDVVRVSSAIAPPADLAAHVLAAIREAAPPSFRMGEHLCGDVG